MKNLHLHDIRSTPRFGRRGFSLIELLLAIFILGVGIISISAVFPAGIVQQRKTQDDVLGTVIAESALSTIRSKVGQSDFGTVEEFGFLGPAQFTEASIFDDFPDSWVESGVAYAQPGDWPWMRPSMAAIPPDETPPFPTYAGDIDIFSARAARTVFGDGYEPPVGDWNSDWITTEFGREIGGALYPLEASPGSSNDGRFLYGIPFNKAKFDWFGGGEDPLVTITQRERFWPAGSGFDPGQARPQYAWDCMFRRFQGRVQGAIFIYRVNAGGTPGGYAVCQDDGAPDLNLPRLSSRPPMPARVDFPRADNEFLLIGGSRYQRLDPNGSDLGPAFVDFTGPDYVTPSNNLDFEPYMEGWQGPGQWLLDPYGRVHRVVQGRRNRRQGPVRLARPIPSVVPSPALYNGAAQPEFPASSQVLQDESDKLTSLWFIPPVDRRGISLTPIYVVVRDL